MHPRDKYSQFVKEILSNPSDEGAPSGFKSDVFNRDKWVHPLSANPFEHHNTEESLKRSSKVASAGPLRQDHISYIKKVESLWRNPLGLDQDQKNQINSVKKIVSLQKDHQEIIRKKKIIAVVRIYDLSRLFSDSIRYRFELRF